MNWNDTINSAFELMGTIAVLISCYKAYKDKQVHSVSIFTVGFFTSWDIWHTYYYFQLHQTFSAVACILLASANLLWATLIVVYKNRNFKRQLDTYFDKDNWKPIRRVKR